MTATDFNTKYKQYLEHRFYGLEIEHKEVIEYLDKEFEKEIQINPDFNYAQIKLKFGFSRVYANSNKTNEWENNINLIIKNNAK